MPTFVFRRDATYYFRRIIPERLRPAFGGKKELVFSLKTKDLATAARLGRLEAVRSDSLFEQAEAKVTLSASPATPPPEGISVAQRTARLAAAWRRERERYAAQGMLSAFEDRLRGAIADHEAVLRGDFPDFPPAPLDFSEAMVLSARAVLTGEGATSIPEIISSPLATNFAEPTLSLTQLTDKWAAEAKPSGRSLLMWRRTCRDFDQMSGAMPVGKVTKRLVLDFKDQLLRNGVKAATVNSRLSHLRALFRFAIANDLLAIDPTAGIRAPTSKRAKESRLPFDLRALETLFSGPVHSKGLRPAKGGDEASYWLPLLALFTGARLNELGQLRTSDVTQEVVPSETGENLVWIIRIAADEDDGLKLKNRGSARRIPVHSSLISLGFLDYLEATKAAGEKRLFPALKSDRFGSVTAYWGKWFGGYLREQGVEDTRIVFHSFRHSFKHYARESGIAKNVNDALTGHESGDVADDYGGLQYPLLPLVAAIKQFRILGFSLPKKQNSITQNNEHI